MNVKGYEAEQLEQEQGVTVVQVRDCLANYWVDYYLPREGFDPEGLALEVVDRLGLDQEWLRAVSCWATDYTEDIAQEMRCGYFDLPY